MGWSLCPRTQQSLKNHQSSCHPAEWVSLLFPLTLFHSRPFYNPHPPNTHTFPIPSPFGHLQFTAGLSTFTPLNPNITYPYFHTSVPLGKKHRTAAMLWQIPQTWLTWLQESPDDQLWLQEISFQPHRTPYLMLWQTNNYGKRLNWCSSSSSKHLSQSFTSGIHAAPYAVHVLTNKQASASVVRWQWEKRLSHT